LQSESVVQDLRAHAIDAHSKFAGQPAFDVHALGKQRCPGEQVCQFPQSLFDMHPGTQSEPPQLHGGGSQIVVGSSMAHSESIVHGFSGGKQFPQRGAASGDKQMDIFGSMQSAPVRHSPMPSIPLPLDEDVLEATLPEDEPDELFDDELLDAEVFDDELLEDAPFPLSLPPIPAAPPVPPPLLLSHATIVI
jgi:hypothetical protein